MVDFRNMKDVRRVAVKCFYCDAIYYMPFDIIGNAVINHYHVEHADKINKEPDTN